jgi:hypothetical protein
MSGRPDRVRLLQFAILLTAGFDLMALVVLVRNTPIAFAAFMFRRRPWPLGELRFLQDFQAGMGDGSS